ncbi:hypothetical protein Y032_0118g770 [Ancylostoma ceylanicum]|nr:hypothetical protein Y032_0118g770 [Ancylostoma ceylanicum]
MSERVGHVFSKFAGIKFFAWALSLTRACSKVPYDVTSRCLQGIRYSRHAGISAPNMPSPTAASQCKLR